MRRTQAWLIFGSAGVLAVTAGVFLALIPPSGEGPTAGESGGLLQAAGNHSIVRRGPSLPHDDSFTANGGGTRADHAAPVSRIGGATTHRTDRADGVAPPVATTGPASATVAPGARERPGAGQPGPVADESKGDLVERARRIEIQANRELERLIPLLDLTPEQQDRLFGVLVRHAPGFDPTMIALGSDARIVAGGAVTDSTNVSAEGGGLSVDAGDAVSGSGVPTGDSGLSGAAGDDASAGRSDALESGRASSAGSADAVVAADTVGSRKGDEVAGRLVKSKQTDVLEVLDVEQGVTYGASEGERDEWWQDIIGYIEAQIDDVPIPGDDPAEDPAELPAYPGD